MPSLGVIRPAQLLRGVYPERNTEILRFAQNDRRRAQSVRSLAARTAANHEKSGYRLSRESGNLYGRRLREVGIGNIS